MSELKLLSCPFCGAAPILNVVEAHTHSDTMKFFMPGIQDHQGSATIECPTSGCCGMIADTEQEVIAAWSRRAQPEATKPAPIPGLPFADLATPIKEFEARKAAALASPADALVAGDRVDALQEIATKLRRAGADIPAPQHDDAIKGATINGLSIALLLVDEAIQAQKDGA